MLPDEPGERVGVEALHQDDRPALGVQAEQVVGGHVAEREADTGRRRRARSVGRRWPRDRRQQADAWVRTAPFGVPVVPLVNRIHAGSSASPSTVGAGSAATHVRLPGAPQSSITSEAPTRCACASSSAGARRWLSGTAIRPAAGIAVERNGVGQPVPAHERDPVARASVRSATTAAVRATSSARSPKVKVVEAKVSAGASGVDPCHEIVQAHGLSRPMCRGSPRRSG